MNGRLYQVYAYLMKMHQLVLDGSRSPFCIELKPDFEWFVEYYEGGLDLITEIIGEE